MIKVKRANRRRTKPVSRNYKFRDATGKDVELQRGDVIGVDRGLYEHYGVYCGNNEVIHYTSAPRRSLRPLIGIYRTNIRRFLGKQKSVFVLDCSDRKSVV